MQLDMSIRVGDVCQLKCGGPRMVIRAIPNEDALVCQWLGRDDVLRNESFHPKTLYFYFDGIQYHIAPSRETHAMPD